MASALFEVASTPMLVWQILPNRDAFQLAARSGMVEETGIERSYTPRLDEALITLA